jgi:hypothetical protein
MKHRLARLRCWAAAQSLLVAPALFALFAGCQTFNSPPANNLASITITNRAMPQITSAIQAVFAEHYFQGGQTGPNEFTYERPGSRASNLAYGSYMFDEKVTMRVTVTVQPVYGGKFLLGCNAALVEDASDPMFQDSHQIRLLRKWPYEQLLKDIRTQLGE